MASDIFEETLELEIGLLEAGPVTENSYPYPSLTPLGRSEARSFRAVILENPYLRATFVPALGGRLLSLFDKRTQAEVLPDGPLTPVEGGRRGAYLAAGIELHLDGRERLTSLAAVQYAAEEPEEDGPAGLWLSEAVTGTGMSWHLHATLPPDRAELRLEARVFNRTWGELPYRAGLRLPALAESRTDGSAFFSSQDGRGVGLIPERGRWDARVAHASLVLSRFEGMRLLAPRQLDTWAMSVIPFSDMGGVSGVGRDGAIGIEEALFRLQAARPLTQHKVVILTKSGQTLEAPLQASPERVVGIPLPEAASGVAVMDANKNVVIRWEGDWPTIPALDLAPSAVLRRPPLATLPEDLESATFDVSTRHIAHALLGNRALASGDLSEAEFRYEQALLYNAEDHLTWWMKAVTQRQGGGEGDEVAEMLNAHYLSPLEPALRAESFFRQPRAIEREPTALLKPMADNPENFIEVAALLVEARLFEEASRWIDEAVRHVDLPMLRYLLAYAHVEATGMDFEAADQLATAAKAPLGPPFPWRPIERVAIEALANRFPDDERLRELLAVMGRLT